MAAKEIMFLYKSLKKMIHIGSGLFFTRAIDPRKHPLHAIAVVHKKTAQSLLNFAGGRLNAAGYETSLLRRRGTGPQMDDKSYTGSEDGITQGQPHTSE